MAWAGVAADQFMECAEGERVMGNLYAERDIIEQGNHYFRHTSAMTSEGLHSKSDIAAELAHRDIEIERLQARAAELSSENDALKKANLDSVAWESGCKSELETALARVAELDGQRVSVPKTRLKSAGQIHLYDEDEEGCIEIVPFGLLLEFATREAMSEAYDKGLCEFSFNFQPPKQEQGQ